MNGARVRGRAGRSTGFDERRVTREHFGPKFDPGERTN
jgi:hypothetical protein